MYTLTYFLFYFILCYILSNVSLKKSRFILLFILFYLFKKKSFVLFSSKSVTFFRPWNRNILVTLFYIIKPIKNCGIIKKNIIKESFEIYSNSFEAMQ